MSINLGGRLVETAGAVMAIVNVTPDSFYARSRTELSEGIRSRVREAVQQGAHILDIGGYSSRVGATEVPAHEEYARLERGLRAAREVAGADFPLSVDTFRAEVVERVYDNFGAVIVNDISAGELDPQMMPLVGRLGLPYIAMHMRGTPQTMASLTDYPDSSGGVVGELLRYFARKIAQARAAGIKDLIIDPGFGFAKTVEQNFELLGRLGELQALGLPILAGLSRKSLIYKSLDITPEEALAGTVALNWEALRQGAELLRVHDVREAVQVVKLIEKINQNPWISST